MSQSLRRQDPGYGQGSHAIDAEDVDAFLVEPREVAEVVRTVLRSPDYRPPLLPAAAMEVHRLSMQSRVDFDAVVAVLEQDQVLASDVLRVAQSPMFARRIPPATLADAVSRLGLGNIRDIVFGVAFGGKVFRAPGYAEVMESIRGHSVATAQVARLLAKGTAVADYAFLCGLLHDVGAAAIVLALADVGRGVAPEALAGVLSDLHEEAGLLLLEAWDLPDQLRDAVAGHHRPTRCEGALALVAHVVASECGRGLQVASIETDEVSSVQLSRACKLLNLSDSGLERLRKQAASILAA